MRFVKELLLFTITFTCCFSQKISILVKAKNQASYEAENLFWGNVSLNFFKEYGISTEIIVANSIKGSASSNYIPYIESALNSTEKSQFDIIQIDFPYIGVFGKYLTDITQYQSKFSNKFINGILNNLFGRENKLKGIPLHLDFGVLFSNQETTIPTTYSEMFDICKSKNYINNNCYLYQNSAEAYSAVINEWLFDSNNGQYISEQTIINLSNKNIKLFFDFLKENVNLLPNRTIVNSDELVLKLNNNETLFTRNWLSTFLFHKNKTANVLPYYNSYSSTLGGFFLGVVENRKYTNLDDIINFLLYISSEKIQYDRLKFFNHIPAIPINTNALSDFCNIFPCSIINKLSIVSRPSKYSQVKDKYREVSNLLTTSFNNNYPDLYKLELDIQNIINPITPLSTILISTISVSIVVIITCIIIIYKYYIFSNVKKNISDKIIDEHKDCLEVLNNYTALNDDEISVNNGDFIYIVEIYSDNWAFGINKKSNEEGILPMYVFGNVYKSATHLI